MDDSALCTWTRRLPCAALGDDPPTAADLAAFEATYPGASGKLAGREGLYVQIVAQALRSDHLAPTAEPDGRWPTFAGSLSNRATMRKPCCWKPR